MRVRLTPILLLLAVLLLSACNLTAQEEELATPTPTLQSAGKPTVTINSPANGTSVRQGEEVLVSATASDTVGVTRVQLFANNTVVKSISSESPTGDRTKNYVLDYTPVNRGEVVLRVVAYRGATASDPAEIRINVGGGTSPTLAVTRQATSPISPTRFPTLDPNDPTCRIQTTSPLNMRSQPITTTNANIITTLPAGAIAQVTGRLADNSWWQIRYNFNLGWVSAAFTNIYGQNCSVVPVIPIGTVITPTVFVPSPTPTATPTATATPGIADLQITNLTGPSQLIIPAGQTSVTGEFSVNVANLGSFRALDFDVQLRIVPADPAMPPLETTIGRLRAGEVISLPYLFSFTKPGQYVVEVEADSGDVVNEQNKANNIAQRIVVVTQGQ